MSNDLFGLWPHQADAVAAIEKAWASGQRAVLHQLPTGGGKSRIIRTIVDNHHNAKRSVYVIAHRNTLVSQLSAELSEIGLHHGLIKAGMPKIAYRVQVASMQTLTRRLNSLPAPDVIIVDEAHHVASNSYKRIFERWPNALVLGETATPQRLDGKGLDDVFDLLVPGPPVADLIRDGFLSEYTYYAPDSVDMQGVHRRAGEYVTSEAEERVDKPAIIGSAIEHYKKYANHQPAIASCISINHAENVASQFREAGYRAKAVHSGLTQFEVQSAINGLRDGSVEILTQCELLGEGVDVPGAVALIGLRPTTSLTIYMQHIGRVLRASKNKPKAVILDHVGNWERFGLPDEPREWSLQGVEKHKKTEQAELKRCPECLQIVPFYAKTCLYCGYDFKANAQPRTIETKDGELREIKPGETSTGFKNLYLEHEDLKQEIYRRVARECRNVYQAMNLVQSLGYDRRQAWTIWTKILKRRA